MMNNNRPLSPHLQVYRLPLTGLISITHRMTGVMLSMGLVLFAVMVSAIAAGSESYTAMQAFISFWYVQIVVWGFIYALFFHLCHGIRHLIWDAGSSFAKDTLDRFAVIELIASLILTGITFFLFL